MGFHKRTVLMVCSLVLLAGASVQSFAQQALKIGYIRPQYIFSQYEPYTAAQKQMDEYQKTEMAKLDKDQQTYQNNVQTFQQQSLVMSEDMQQQRQEELLKQRDALEQAYDELTRVDGTLDTKQQELLGPIIDSINEIITKIGDAEKYDLILDATAGGVVYANEKFDISDAVITELKKGAGAATSTTK